MQTALGRYYNVWSVLVPLLAMPRTYTFVTGKSAAFSLIGLQAGPISSPSPHCGIIMGALNPGHIQYTFEKSTLTDGTLLPDVIPVANGMLVEFCRRVQQLTAGTPRLVHACLEALAQLRLQATLDTKEQIEQALEQAFKLLVGSGHESATSLDVKRQVFFPALDANRHLTGVFCGLLLAALLEWPMPNNANIVLDDSTTARLLDVANRLDVFIDPNDCPENTFRIRFSQWATRALSERIQKGELVDRRLPLVTRLLSVPQEVLGKGEPLEWVLRTQLVSTLGHAKLTGRITWGELCGIFCDTVVATQKVELLSSHPIRLLPKVVTQLQQRPDLKALAASPEQAWQCTMAHEDWSELFQCGLFPPNSIGHPAPLSACPDILVRCSDNVVMGFLCKLGQTPITWADLKEEIAKAEPLLKAAKQVCLVLVALTLGAQLEDAFNDGNRTKLLLGEGGWARDGKALVRIQNQGQRSSRSKTQAVEVLQVPVGMEVVILGSAGLRLLLGDVNIDALGELVKDRNSPQLLWTAMLPLTTSRGSHKGTFLAFIVFSLHL